MRAALLLTLAVSAFADNSVPSPAPAPSWQARCGHALEQALSDVARELPGFYVCSDIRCNAEVHTSPAGVDFDALVADAEHARFYHGEPAHFFVHVRSEKHKEPGEIGGTVGNARDEQASAGYKRWTRERLAELDVQIAGGKKVFVFHKRFTRAVDECLR
jgi:hypothetical protein